MATTTAKANTQPGYDVVVTTAFELIGVGLLALLAGISDQVGHVVVIVMVGFLIAWALANTDTLSKWVGNLLWVTSFGRFLPCSSWAQSSSP
jgi:hypothetical protein